MNPLLAQVGPVELKQVVRGREVPMTTEHQIVSIMDSCRQRMPYGEAVRHTARFLQISEGEVRFVWVGWNQGSDSF